MISRRTASRIAVANGRSASSLRRDRDSSGLPLPDNWRAVSFLQEKATMFRRDSPCLPQHILRGPFERALQHHARPSGIEDFVRCRCMIRAQVMEFLGFEFVCRNEFVRPPRFKVCRCMCSSARQRFSAPRRKLRKRPFSREARWGVSFSTGAEKMIGLNLRRRASSSRCGGGKRKSVANRFGITLPLPFVHAPESLLRRRRRCSTRSPQNARPFRRTHAVEPCRHLTHKAESHDKLVRRFGHRRFQSSQAAHKAYRKAPQQRRTPKRKRVIYARQNGHPAICGEMRRCSAALDRSKHMRFLMVKCFF